MGAISEAIRHAITFGATKEQILAMVQDMEAAERPLTGAERTKRWRESQKDDDGSGDDVTSHVTVPIISSISNTRGKGGTGERGEIVTALEPIIGLEQAKAVIAHRQKLRKPMTVRAAKLLAAEFAKAGNPSAAADEMIARGWTGFKLDWLKDDQKSAKKQGFSGPRWQDVRYDYEQKYGKNNALARYSEDMKALVKGEKVDALVCRDDEGPQGRTGPKEPKMARLRDFLPPLQPVDNAKENQAALCAEAVPDAIPVCGDEWESQAVDLPDQQHDWGGDNGLLWAAGVADSGGYNH